jgi:hypothetical protein
MEFGTIARERNVARRGLGDWAILYWHRMVFSTLQNFGGVCGWIVGLSWNPDQKNLQIKPANSLE